MKKAVSLFLACIMIFSVFALAASAYKVVSVTCDTPTVGESSIIAKKMTVTDSGSSDAVSFMAWWYAYDASETINLKTRDFSKDAQMTGKYKEGYQYVLCIYLATDVSGYKAPEKITVNGNAMTKNSEDLMYYYNFGEPAAAESTSFFTTFINAITNVFKTLANLVVKLITTFTSVAATTTTETTTAAA